MFNKKTKLKLTDFECNLLINGMNEFRNMLLSDGIPTEDVDELLLKIINKSERYQSFKKGEVTPEECHTIGVETARRLWVIDMKFLLRHISTPNLICTITSCLTPCHSCCVWDAPPSSEPETEESTTQGGLFGCDVFN